MKITTFLTQSFANARSALAPRDIWLSLARQLLNFWDSKAFPKLWKLSKANNCENCQKIVKRNFWIVKSVWLENCIYCIPLNVRTWICDAGSSILIPTKSLRLVCCPFWFCKTSPAGYFPILWLSTFIIKTQAQRASTFAKISQINQKQFRVLPISLPLSGQNHWTPVERTNTSLKLISTNLDSRL